MCMVDACEEPWSWSSIRERKARKAHRCSECEREIELGERYMDGRAGYDGSVSVWKTCAHCAAAVSWLQETCRGYLIHGALEDLLEHWNERIDADGRNLRSGYLGRSIIGMRRKWRRRDGALMAVPAPWKVAA